MSRPKTVYTFVGGTGIVRVSAGRYYFGATDDDNSGPCHKGRVVVIAVPRYHFGERTSFYDATDPDVPFVSGFDTEFSKSGLDRIEDLEQAINYVAGVIP